MATTRNYQLSIDRSDLDQQRATLADLIDKSRPTWSLCPSGRTAIDYLEGLQALCDEISDQESRDDSPDVVLVMHDGCITARTIPSGCKVQVRDYGIPADWECTDLDEDGDSFQLIELTG